MSSGIYCIENMFNGLKYIGWARDIEKRFKKHVWMLKRNKHHNNHLQNSWNKYGENSFKLWIIDEYYKEESLKLMEIYFISFYKSFCDDGGGYNLTRGGEGKLGHVFTDEAKQLISESKLGKNNFNYGKFGKDNPHYGHIHTSESKSKMSMAVYKRKNPKTKEKDGKLTSPYYGVSKVVQDSNRIYWVARIYSNGKSLFQKYLKNELDAAKEYDKYVIKNNLSKPLNFPTEV
jgi:group I intron endonuclease